MIAPSHNSSHRIAIVGAGPGGLAAGILLASRGVEVTIYEKQPIVGGRTGQVSVGDYRFDLGPTFYLMPYVLQEIFKAAGKDLYEELDLTRLDPMYRLVVGQPDGSDVTIDATQDIAEMGRRIAAVHPRDGERFAAFIDHNRKKLDAAEPILRRPIRSLLDLARPDAMRAAPLIQPLRSVHDLNSRYFEHPAVRLAVGFQSKYLGMSPKEAPSLFTILPYIEYEYGVWHPSGGCHAIMTKMADIFRELGGTIETGVSVERAEMTGRRVTGLSVERDNGAKETVACDHAVFNADATWALKNIFPESVRGRVTDATLDDKKYSCSTYMLYLGVEGAIDLPHHTIRTARAYEQNLEDIARDGGARGTLSEDPSYYLCNASVTDPTLAPEGHSSLYILMPTPNTKAPIDWHAEGPKARERLLDLIHRDLGIELRGRIRAEKQITPDDWAAMNINHGATFNLAHSLDQMLHKRVPHRAPFADGAWFVGGATHPGSGLPVIFLSAQITARMLLDEIGLTPPPPVVVTTAAQRHLQGAGA
jgi:phytoene desaturase